MTADADHIVLDTSIVGPMMIADEQHSLSADAIPTMLESRLIVPAHWRLEVANMLRSAMRRGRMTIEVRDRILDVLSGFPVEMDGDGWNADWARTLDLSDRHGLTPYDAAYVELAKRRGAALATRDMRLAAAAAAEGIRTMDFIA